MRRGVRGIQLLVTTASLALLGAGCSHPIEWGDDDGPPIEPYPLPGGSGGTGGKAGSGGKAGAGGVAGQAGEAGQGGEGGQGGVVGGDVLDRLRAIAGVADVVELEPSSSGARAFTFTIEQPIDHTRPEIGVFTQRVQLLHRGEVVPTVLRSTGYQLFGSRPGDSEPSVLLGGNSLTVEHRFFNRSTPGRENGGEPPPEAWGYLTIEQAAADHHRVVEALKPLYSGVWISTGASKGGMTSVYHRRFYPDDVAGTVAYVAPHSFGTDDQRYVAFLEQVGDAACRDRIVALQRDVLTRRDELLPLFTSVAADQGLTFDFIGLERAYEHTTQELRFAFWQYADPVECETLPAPGAPAEDAIGALDLYVSLALAADQSLVGVDTFASYYFQAATELGSYGPLELHLEDLLQFPRTYSAEVYAPPVPGHSFDPAPMFDVAAWVASEAERIIFIYGENDPWSAGAYATGPATGRDLHSFVVPGGNHGAYITHPNMPEESLHQAVSVLRSWAGVTPVRPPMVERRQRGAALPWEQLPPFRFRL